MEKRTRSDKLFEEFICFGADGSSVVIRCDSIKGMTRSINGIMLYTDMLGGSRCIDIDDSVAKKLLEYMNIPEDAFFHE